MTTIRVDNRAAHRECCIGEALVRKCQLLLFRFRQITAQVDEEDTVALGCQTVIVKLHFKEGSYAIMGVGAISRNSMSNIWSSFGTASYMASL